MNELTKAQPPNWNWLEHTREMFDQAEEWGWDHLSLLACWEHGPNIYRLSGTQMVPADLGGRQNGYGEHIRKFEIVGDVRDLPGMLDQLNAEFRAAVTARN